MKFVDGLGLGSKNISNSVESNHLHLIIFHLFLQIGQSISISSHYNKNITTFLVSLLRTAIEVAAFYIVCVGK